MILQASRIMVPSLLVLLLVCHGLTTTGLALAPSPSPRWRRPLMSSSSSSSSVSAINYWPLSLSVENNANIKKDPRRMGMRQKISRTILRRKFNNIVEDAPHSIMAPSASLFASRPQSERKLPIVLQMLSVILWRIVLGSKIAWASSSSKTPILSQSPATAIGRQRILNALRSIPNYTITPLRKINNKRKIQLAITTGVAVMTFLNIVETIKAHRRQKIDPTSEWGRYADNPSARGMALTLLLMRLVPYAILPAIIEKTIGKSKKGDEYIGYNDKIEYESSRAHRLRKQGGQLFADGLLRLGPLYIKIGQILSCRENLFPDEWITAMEKLQDRVPAKSGREAWELLYAACPGGEEGFHQLFTDFDDVPLAAASLGQVHKARLRSTNEHVAIKIQRARLRDIYDKDLALMKKISKIADSLGKAGQVGGVEQSWEGIFRDAETILYREIDYRDEAENAMRFASDFGIGLGGIAVESTAKAVDGKKLPSAAEWMRTPYTYAEMSSEKFLVMEFVPSIKVTNHEKLKEAAVTDEDREYLAEALARAYLRQFCTHKFFSTDPHPGNLGIEVFDDGRLPRMVFYDFGQACALSHDQAGGILEVIESIIDLDAKKSVAAFSRMGVLKENADLEKVQAKCQQNYDTGKLKVKKRKTRSSARYRRNDLQSTPVDTDSNDALEMRLEASEQILVTKQTNTDSDDVKDAEVMGYFTLKSEYAFVARALSQMDGVGKSLDPEFDFISASAPYLVEVKGTGRYLSDEIKKRLSFVYDPDDGVLAKEVAWFKSLGFKPKGDD